MGRLGPIVLGLLVCQMLGAPLASVGWAASPEASVGHPVDHNLVRAERPGRRVPAIPASDLSVEKGTLPVTIAGAPYSLETLTVTPPGTGPFPLAVISHGNPRDAANRRTTKLRTLLPIAEDFARWGYRAVVFARRGFAGSTGEFVEGNGSCPSVTAESFARAGRTAAVDFAAVIEAAAADPRVDRTKVVAAGHSGGGFAVSALASAPPKGLVAVVSFSGGRGSPSDHQNCNADALVEAFGAFGRTASVPALWLYSETDRFFWPELVNRSFAAYTATAAPARLAIVGPLWYAKDGHALYRLGGRELWRPALDAFLADIGAPTWTEPPADLALRRSGPPDLAENGQEAWLIYLSGSDHKAFVTGPSGRFGWAINRDSREEAMGTALGFCQAKGATCRIVSVDGD